MKAVVPQPTGLIGEFMDFIKKTNAVALAIGVILGGAATKLVEAIMTNLLNPILGAILGGADLNNTLAIKLGQAADGAPNLLRIGGMIGAIINFVALMAVLFIIIKLVAKDMLAEKK
jgi:large conductance mechanosensitive channel